MLGLNRMNWLMRVVNILVLVQSRRLLSIRSILNFRWIAKLIRHCGWLTLISFDLVVLVLKLEGLVWRDGVADIRFEITVMLGFSLWLWIKWWILRKASSLLNWAGIDILKLGWIYLILVRVLNILALVIKWWSGTRYFLFCELMSGLLMCQIWWRCFEGRNNVLTPYDQLGVGVSKWHWLWLIVKNFFFCRGLGLVYFWNRSRSMNSLLGIRDTRLNLRLTENWLGAKLLSNEYFSCWVVVWWWVSDSQSVFWGLRSDRVFIGWTLAAATYVRWLSVSGLTLLVHVYYRCMLVRLKIVSTDTTRCFMLGNLGIMRR